MQNNRKANLAKISLLMQDESPVFIVGAPRSGTSILYRTLQQHSSFQPKNVHNSSGVELTESNVFKDPYNTYSRANNSVLAYFVNNQDCYEQFLQDTQFLQTYQRLLLGKKALHRLSPFLPGLRTSVWRANSNHLLIRNFFYYAKQARGMERIIEKTPQHIYYLPEIKATFPQAKLLFILRHPLDVFSSYRKRLRDSLQLGMPQSDLKWLQMSPRSFCFKYNLYARIALQQNATNKENFLLIDYENFTNNNEAVLHKLLALIGEEPEAKLFNINQTNNDNWQLDKKLFSSVKKNTKNWQDFVNRSEAIFIETKLAPLMNKLNYEKYSH